MVATPENKRVQQPGNTTLVSDEYTGPPRQITVDVDRNELRLHDGRKPGGWRIPNLTQLKRLFITSDSEVGQISFSDEIRGFMARVADKTYRLRTLTEGDGIIITNPDGQAGNPQISVEGRLAGESSPIDDCNAAVKSGTYVTLKTANALPAPLQGVANAVLTVTAGRNESDQLLIMQQAISLSTATNTAYIRRFAAGVWSGWV